jgi:hypothetical protein
MSPIERSIQLVALAGRLGVMQATLINLSESVYEGNSSMRPRMLKAEMEICKIRLALGNLQNTLKESSDV